MMGVIVQLIPLTPPHPPVVCNTMWALTAFTADNGATRVVQDSHRWGKPTYGGDHPTEPAIMDPGDVLVWNGSLWHAGGANRTDRDRVGIAVNHRSGWIRQLEMVGYSVYQGLIGHIERRSPIDLLADSTSNPDAGTTMVWDRT